MKLKRLSLKNFAKFTDFTCMFNEKLTRLVGVNGSGKTTIGLTSIWSGLKGIAEKSKDGQLIGERFRFIGKGKKTADIEIVVFDEKTGKEVTICNHISKSGNKITCSPVQEEGWLGNLLSVAFLSAKNFTALNGKDQALLLGIDTAKYDEKIFELKMHFTHYNGQLRGMGKLEEVPESKHVNITEIVKRKDSIEREYREKQSAVVKHNNNADIRADDITRGKATIEDIDAQIAILLQKKEVTQQWINEHPSILINVNIDPPNTLEMETEIATAEDTNRNASAYQVYTERKKEKEKIEKDLASNKDLQIKAIAKRLEYIKSFKFGFAGLGVDEHGSLLLDERPLKDPYFSKGELEIIVAKLAASLNPELKVRFIDDFELLDEANQEKILKDLLDQGFQVITAEVGEDSGKDNVIILKECQSVDTDGERLL